MANILILGGGFGGLMMAERLVAALGGGSQHRLTLISTHDEFIFYPALVKLAFGALRADEITIDLVDKLNQLDVRFIQGEVLKINFRNKRVQVTGKDLDGEVSYDYLVIALGRRLATEKIRGFFEHSHHLLSANAAARFSESVKSFSKGRIVVGLTPDAFLPVPVCETAFALARKYEREIAANDVSITIVFPESIKQAFGGADLHQKLESAFAKFNINVVTDFAIDEISEKAILTGDKQAVEYDLLMLLPPFRGQTLLGSEPFVDESNFINTDNFLRVSGLDKVYAVGDITAFPGPKLAYMAVRQAQIAADNIIADLRGADPRKTYRHDLAVIIDVGGEDAIFLHYGIEDESLYGLKEGKMWSRMKNKHNRLWEVMRDS